MSSSPEPNSLSADQLEHTFAEIYRRGLWGSDAGSLYYSGVGSHKPVIVDPYIEAVRSFASTHLPGADAVDLGCGDFNVGSKLCDIFRQTIACDIVSELLDHNKERFKTLPVKFVKLDIVRDKLPDGRVAFLRQVLQHLSNDSIIRIIDKLYAYQYIIVTEHVPFNRSFQPNMDKPDGIDIRPDHGSGVLLTAAPFSLKIQSEHMLCEVADGIGLIRTTAYKLR